MKTETFYTQHLRDCSKRAKQKGLAFELDLPYVITLLEKQGYCCCLTGLQFQYQNISGYHRNPYAPSIDRIDSRQGYTKGNVRIVCVSVNIALNEWGLEVFDTIVRSRYKNSTASRKPDHAVGLFGNAFMSMFWDSWHERPFFDECIGKGQRRTIAQDWWIGCPCSHPKRLYKVSSVVKWCRKNDVRFDFFRASQIYFQEIISRQSTFSQPSTAVNT